MEDFTLNPKFVLIALESLDSVLIRANLSEGIIAAISSIIEVYKKISEKSYRVVMLTDNRSIKIPGERMPVLEDLMEKIKNIPVFFDLIHNTGNTQEEDSNLKKLVEMTSGFVYNINKIRRLQPILNKLAENTANFMNSSFKETYKYIPEEYHGFYERMAEKPLKVIENSTCSICFQKDEGLVQCPSCETLIHESCWALWARTSSIGILHVFRCHNCFKLVKLDHEFVRNVHLGVLPVAKKINVEVINVQQYLESMEPVNVPKIIRVNFNESKVINVEAWLKNEAEGPTIIQSDDPVIIKDDKI